MDIPEDVVRFSEGEVAAGRYASVDDVLRAAGIASLRRSLRREEYQRRILEALLQRSVEPEDARTAKP